jgi:hypothetical protein
MKGGESLLDYNDLEIGRRGCGFFEWGRRLVEVEEDLVR